MVTFLILTSTFILLYHSLRVHGQTSYNFGVTVNVNAAWQATALSQDGTYLFASGQGLIYRSANGGSGWSAIQPAGSSTSNYQWTALGCDSTGKYVFAAASGQGVWTSSNFGVGWTQSLSLGGGTINDIEANPSGQYVVLVTAGSKYLL